MIDYPRPARTGCAVLLAVIGAANAGAIAAAGAGARVGLRSGAVNTAAEPNEWPALRRGDKPGGLYLIQLESPITADRTDRLKAAGDEGGSS